MASIRLPIVLCIDVSPCMGQVREDGDSCITLLNTAINDFLDILRENLATREAVEIAIVTYSSSIEMDTPFIPVRNITHRELKAANRGATNFGDALMKSLVKIEERLDELNNNDYDYFAPFLVIVTDGILDGNYKNAIYEKSIELVRKHCDSRVGMEEIIVPLIIDVGEDKEPEALYSYSDEFINGYIHVKGDNKDLRKRLEKIFKFIGNTIHQFIYSELHNEERYITSIRGIKTAIKNFASSI